MLMKLPGPSRWKHLDGSGVTINAWSRLHSEVQIGILGPAMEQGCIDIRLLREDTIAV